MADTVSHSAVGRPAPALRPYIDAYVGYHLRGFPPGLHRGVPSRHLTCIVSTGPTIDVVAQTDPAQAPASYGFVVGGLQTTPALISHQGHQEGIAVELTPLGSRSLFGMPARALWSTSVEGADVIGRAGVELRDRLDATEGWADRFAVCDEVFGRLLREPTPVAPEVREAWRMIVTSGGSVPVAHLAAEVGWSRRHLAGRFGEEFGLSPKAAARLVRFDRARHLLQHPDRPGLADVAAACGYYDQSHLNRDFVDLAGCPPGQWLIEEGIPSVQDDGITVGR